MMGLTLECDAIFDNSDILGAPPFDTNRIGWSGLIQSLLNAPSFGAINVQNVASAMRHGRADEAYSPYQYDIGS